MRFALLAALAVLSSCSCAYRKVTFLSDEYRQVFFCMHDGDSRDLICASPDAVPDQSSEPAPEPELKFEGGTEL